MAGKSSALRSLLSDVLRSPYFWALALRVAVFAALSPIELKGDAADFHLIAANLAAGHGFSRCTVSPFPPTAQRPPLFALFLAGLYFLGAGSLWAPFVLNLVFDLLSIRLARAWAEENGFGSGGALRFSWIVALCPLLIAYAPYPTTENLSISLFLAATLLTFRLGRAGETGRSGWGWAAAGGMCWGWLALCRSYYLLFPAILFVIPSSPKWRRGQLAVLLAFSFAAPLLWVARNDATFGKPVFSQGSTVGWQSYQGLCFANFDWWNPNDVARIYQHPVLSRMLASQCSSDDDLARLDLLVRNEVIQECVLDRPLEAAANTAIKGGMLFINWGQLLPYTRIPEEIRWTINTLMALYWWCVAAVFIRKRREREEGKANGSYRAASRYALTGILYVVAVTLPFAVDSRYLLGPFLITLAAALQAAGGAKELLRAGFTWSSDPSRSGSRTP